MAGAFNCADWINNTNIYEVNLRQYTPEGTFEAFAAHLPRLKNMGVKTLWFMPITPIAQKNKKGSLGSPYACSDYTSINPEFGTMDDFKALVAKAHGMGFKVIIDWVANHTGWDHRWTKEYPDYYLFDANTNDFKVASGMDDIIELDYKNPALRKAMIESMRFWINEMGIDGFRCDLASWVDLDFWREARTELEKTKKIFWLGEMDGIDDAAYLSVFDAAYTWTWMHRTKDYYENKISFEDLYQILLKYDGAASNALLLWFTANHDENSWNGTEYEKYGKLAHCLAVFSFTWNGIPLIYSGQEIPSLKRLKFFDKDAIDWPSNSCQLQGFYATLISLKERNAALLGGDINVKTYFVKAGEKVLAFLRKNGEQEVLVLLNFSGNEIDFTINEPLLIGNYKSIFESNTHIEFGQAGQAIKLQPWEYSVYEK